jgi:hypothetical protein
MGTLLQSLPRGLRRGGEHRLEDAHEAGTTAEIAGKRLANFGNTGMRVIFEKLRCSHQHAGRADATLCAAALEECFLEWMQNAM